MPFKRLMLLSLLIGGIFPFESDATFIAKRESLKRYENRSDVVVIASTGRSGSTMLTSQINKYAPKHRVLKTHLLPPDQSFKGKVIFIFSNPDQAAESALYMTFHYKGFEERHFKHVETADRGWLKKIGGPGCQTKQHNLLSYDALRTYEHLNVWLHTQTKPSDFKNGQILAVKYENLWDESVVQAIRDFLDIPLFKLPPQSARGHKESKLYSIEIAMKKMYNLGTATKPRYAAYDDARLLWEQAPPFQFLEIRN